MTGRDADLEGANRQSCQSTRCNTEPVARVTIEAPPLESGTYEYLVCEVHREWIRDHEEVVSEEDLS